MLSLNTDHKRARPGLASHVGLLLSCAGTKPDGHCGFDTDIDWRCFAALVEHHGMGPHVHQILDACREVPAPALLELRQLHQRASEYNLLLTARMLQVVEAFAQAGIPVVTLKGPALAQQLYGDPGMRDSLDLDLLVPSRRVEAAARLLQEHGYVLESELGWLGVRDLARRSTELTFRHASGTAVDLHWAIAPADYPCRIPESRLWASVNSVSIAGRRVPVLGKECLLVYLCVHGTTHCWTKLRWLCDVAMVVSSVEIDWDQVDVIAVEGDASRALSLALILVRDLLGVELPANASRRVRDEDRIAPFAARVADRLRAPAPAPQPTAVERTIFNARLAMNGWLRARHLAALMKAPTDADALLVKLPRQLLFLYYPLRVARLAARYGRAVVAG